MFKVMLLATLVLVCCSVVAQAAVKTKTVTYTYDGTTFKGHLAWDDDVKGKRPGILVVHEFWGLNDYARQRADQLAGLGYVAFAADMYGDGKAVEVDHPKEASEMAAAVRKNVKNWQGRAQAALKILQDNDMVDSKKLAAIGYCFGGSTALELAYSGADVAAVVSFHGAIPVPDSDQAKAIKAKVLVCTGAADKFIKEEDLQKLRSTLDEAKADYQVIYYGGAKHSFTVPTAEKAANDNMAYNANADKRSWAEMLRLFDEVFGKGK
jgi:dienelactone hydrolase